MSIIEALAAELEQESAGTRKYLERVPEEHFGWKPHEKSFTMGELSSHLANILNWAVTTFEVDEFIFNPQEFVPFKASTHEELMAEFDKNVPAALGAIRKSNDEQLSATWRMKMGDKVLFEMPRIAVFRSMIMHHTAHHRGQLGIYLRMKDVPLPKLYGPTADDQSM